MLVSAFRSRGRLNAKVAIRESVARVDPAGGMGGAGTHAGVVTDAGPGYGSPAFDVESWARQSDPTVPPGRPVGAPALAVPGR